MSALVAIERAIELAGAAVGWWECWRARAAAKALEKRQRDFDARLAALQKKAGR